MVMNGYPRINRTKSNIRNIATILDYDHQPSARSVAAMETTLGVGEAALLRASCDLMGVE